MANIQAAIDAPPNDTMSVPDRLEAGALIALFGLTAFTQVSIAISQSLLALAFVGWLGRLIVRHERPDAPRFFWPLLAYAGATLLSAAFSRSPAISFLDSKQLVLFLVVPLVYRLASGARGSAILTVIVSVGAASAALGIFQYGLLHYDQLIQRPQGTLGHYMTYSGLLMLVIAVALSRILFGPGQRLWSALVMPALLMAIALTSTRNAWVGACAAGALLLTLKDFRLLAAIPIVAALVFAAAPAQITHRFNSMFDASDPTRRDRAAMLREGRQMVRAHPLVGVGPDMVKVVYAEYRDPEAVERVNPHLHNVPVQIAAERGLPAVALWAWFIGLLGFDLWRQFRTGEHRVLAAAALAAVVSMLSAGLFEYNFGDSEFLMMFLIIVTLPFAAARRAVHDRA